METKQAVIELIKVRQRIEAIELIEAQDSAEKVAQTYSSLVRDIYWSDKNGTNLVFFGKAGVIYCLEKSETSPSMKTWARTLAEDVAANTWPGWKDPGVVISEEDREEGLGMAKLNLTLTLELQDSMDKVAAAHWLIGAHLLAKGERELAVGAFKVAKEISFEPKGFSVPVESLSMEQLRESLCRIIERRGPRRLPIWC